jgi:hydroxypyruvate reductase
MQPEKFSTRSLSTAPWGDQVVRILAASIQAVDPYDAVIRHLNLVGENLHLGRQTYFLRRYRRIFLVGAGKAGLPMARAVVDKIGAYLAGGVVIVKEGYGGPAQVGPVRIFEAGHPVPDRRGVQATGELLSLLEQTQADDLVLVVISGGGSVLLTQPVAGVSLADMQVTTDELLASGADINEINRIRKQLDQVKGGGLAKAAAPAPSAALILSDVVGDPLGIIASGPTVIETGKWHLGYEVVQKYQLEDKLPAPVTRVLRYPIKPPPFMAQLPNNILIGNNELAARAGMEKAAEFGLHTELLTTSLVGEAREVGEQMARQLREYSASAASRPALWLAGGETTVTLRGKGAGGRNQELALAAVATLSGMENAAMVTLATDGGDGPTDAAGAVVTGDTLDRAQSMGMRPQDYLENNDSYTFFSKLGDCLMPGPTQTNVNDLLFLFLF